MDQGKRPRQLYPVLPPPRKPYKDPTITLSLNTVRHFDEVVSALSDSGTVTIIAEGTPLAATLSDEAMQKLAGAWPADGAALTAPLSQVLPLVASAFDYEAIRTDDQTFLLFKRFSNPDDLPFVTMEEAEKAYKNIQRALTPLLPPLFPKIEPANQPGSPLYQLTLRLTEEYPAETLRPGIPISSLKPEQQELLHQFAIFGYVSHGLEPLSFPLQLLEMASSPDAFFCHLNYWQTGVWVLGFQGPFGPDKRVVQFGISHGLQIDRDRTPGRITDPIPDTKLAQLAKQNAQQRLIDADAPKPEDYALSSAVPSPHLRTLKTLVDSLTEQNRSTDQTFTLDDVLQSKPVSVFGLDRLSPEQILKSIALLYGLHLQHRTSKEWFLTLYAPRAARSINELPGIFEQAFPQPWRRALLGVAQEREKALNLETQQNPSEKKMSEDFMASQHHFRAPRDAEDLIFKSAVRRLRVLIEPKLKNAPEGRLSLRSMTEEEKRLYALACASKSLQRAENFMCNNPSPCLTNFSEAYVMAGTPNYDPAATLLYLGTKAKNGSVSSDLGTIIRPRPKP